MAVDERSRHELYERLAQALGPEAAVTMMEHLPPIGWSDVTTKHDLAQLEQRLQMRFELLEQRVGARFELVDQKLEGLEHRMLSAFRGEIAAALTSQTRTIIFTMAGSLVTMSAFAIAIARLS